MIAATSRVPFRLLQFDTCCHGNRICSKEKYKSSPDNKEQGKAKPFPRTAKSLTV